MFEKNLEIIEIVSNLISGRCNGKTVNKERILSALKELHDAEIELSQLREDVKHNMNYKKIVDKLNHQLSTLDTDNTLHWFYFELQQYHNLEGDVTLIYLIDSGNSNKYRVYHSELSDWISNDVELEDDIITQLNEYVDNLANVVSNVSRIVNHVNEMNRIAERGQYGVSN